MARFLAHVDDQERRETLWAAATVFLVLMAHAVLEVARDSIFLTHLPASHLPWMYLALAGLALLATRPLSRSVGGRGDLRQLVIIQLAAAAGTLVLLIVIHSRPVWAIYALYLWGGLASTAILIRFWLFLADRFTIRQAKRLFPVIAAGPLLGSLVGYGVAGLLYHRVPSIDLLGISAVVFLLSAGCSVMLARAHSTSAASQAADESPPGETREPEPTLREGIRMAVHDTYMRRIVLLLLVASVTVTLGDFIFKSTVARDIPAARIGSFLSLSYFTFDLIALGLLFTAVVPFMRARGVSDALSVEPGFLLLGGILLTAVGGLIPVLLLRGVDGALRWSLHKTATELLYVPLAPRLRSAVKALTDVVAHRGGQALGSIMILGWLFFSSSERLMGALIAGCAVTWIVLARSLRRPYLDLFRDTLNQGSIETRLEFPELDMASLETLIAALSSPDEHKVCAAMDLLHKTERSHLMPLLILYHPSVPVVLRALEIFAATRRQGVLPLTTHLVQHADGAVRAAAIRTGALIQPDVEQLRSAAQSDSAGVAVTALVILTAQGHLDVATATARLAPWLDERRFDAGAARCFLARALRDYPIAAFASRLDGMAADGDLDIRREAIQAIGALRHAANLPTLIGALSIRELRPQARDALLAFADPGLQSLEKALVDAALPRAARIHLPRTISAFATQTAADILLRQLVIEASGAVKYKILRGLGRMIVDGPHLQLDTNLVDEVIERQIAALIENLRWMVALQNGAEADPARCTPGHELLAGLLQQRNVLALERLFRTLGLRYRDADLGQIYDGLQSDDTGARASGRELLDGVLPARLARLVLTLTDRRSAAERLAALPATENAEPLEYQQLLRCLLQERSTAVRHLAAHHAAELGLLDPDAEPPLSGAAGDWLSVLRSRPVDRVDPPGPWRAQA